MTDEEIQKIVEAITKVYEENGKKIQTVIQDEDIKDDGTIEGTTLVDNRDEEDIN